MAHQALPGKRKDVIYMDPEDLTVVGIDTDDGPEHPLYDERIKLPLNDATVRNIMHFGVLQPIVVRKDGDQNQVVAGRRRTIHCREANRRLRKRGMEEVRIPALNRRGTDVEMVGILISENEIRQDDSPLAKARKVQKMLDLGATREEVATVFGVTTKSIDNWTRLLDCDDKVIKAVESHKISASAAAKLAKLSRAEQRENLAEILESGNVSTKQTAALARSKTKKKVPGEEDEGVLIAPGKKTITKVLALVEDGAELDPAAVKALRWAIGELDARNLKGLTKLLNTIEAEAAEKRQKKRVAQGKKKAPVRTK